MKIYKFRVERTVTQEQFVAFRGPSDMSDAEAASEANKIADRIVIDWQTVEVRNIQTHRFAAADERPNSNRIVREFENLAFQNDNHARYAQDVGQDRDHRMAADTFRAAIKAIWLDEFKRAHDLLAEASDFVYEQISPETWAMLVAQIKT